MTRVPAYLLLSTMMSAGFALSALAQSAPATPPAATPPAASTPTPQAAAPEPSATSAAAEKDKAEEARRRTAAADRNAMFEAHLAALHAGLTLNPDQDKLWPPVEQAIRGFVAMRAERMQRQADRMHEQDDEDPIAAFKVYSDGLLARAQALHALATAADPLYATLGDEQKHRLPALLRDMGPHDGPLARMADRFDREQGQGRGDRMNRAGEEDRPRYEGRRGGHDWRHDARGSDWSSEDMDHSEHARDRADDHDGDRMNHPRMDRDRDMSEMDGESWHRGHGRQRSVQTEDDGDDE